MKKCIYRKPAVDAIPVENEGVMAASQLRDINPGKRYGMETNESHLPVAPPRLGCRMRNLFPLLSGLTLLMLASCSNSDEPTANDSQEKFRLTVTANRGGSNTRTEYEDRNDNKMLVYWNDPADEEPLRQSETINVIRYENDLPYIGTPTDDSKYSFVTLTGTAATAKSVSMDFAGTVSASTGTYLGGKYNYVYPAQTGSSTVSDTISYRFTGQQQTCISGRETNHLQDYDVMYTPQAVDATFDAGGNLTSSFTFSHAAALLRFRLTLPEPKTIAAIRLHTTDGTTPFYPELTLTCQSDNIGTVSPTNSGTPDNAATLTLTSAGASTVVTGYLMSPPVDFDGTSFEVLAAATDGIQYAYRATAAADDRLEAGTCNTFDHNDVALTRRSLTWAGSNIYWDKENNRLTFAEPGTTDKQQYQGVLFKYGSLVGISPYYNGSTTFDITVTPLFVPTDFSEGLWAEVKEAGETPWETYSTIPVVNTSTMDDHISGLIEENKDWTDYKGDICAYLSGKSGVPEGTWRMPTFNEWNPTWLPTRSSDTSPATSYSATGVWNGNITASNKFEQANQTDGTAIISGYATHTVSGTLIPASGYRNSTGELSYVGRRGWYYAANGKRIYFSALGYMPFVAGQGNVANPVRCVKVEE
ncbi:MAG: hypothetical protein LBN06_03895 [Prevotellaceae bacterium]|nr:hypothetical protein [Prevotellaceae bacterium]